MAKAQTEDLETETEFQAPVTKQSTDTVLVTITKFGEGKVSTGEHIAEFGDRMAKRGDVLEVSKTIATALEAKGFGEI